MAKRLSVLAGFAISLFVATISHTSSAAVVASPPSHPLVIVFATGQETGTGATAAADGDATTAAERTMRSAQAVRDCLNDSNAVTGTIYQPDGPLFRRAAQEAKITIEKRYELGDAEQLSLGKAAGAIYVVVIGSHKTTDGSGSDEMDLLGRDVATHKVWKDHARFKGGAVLPPPVGDANALPSEKGPALATANAMYSAANTLVARLLNGPLAEYGRPAPSPEQLPGPVPAPPPAAPVVAPAPTPPVPAPPHTAASTPSAPPAEPEAETVKAAAQQAQTLLNDGDNDAAILLLRRTINQAPLNGRLRLLLARAYLAANRNTDAVAEATRALTLTPPESRADRVALTHLLADAMRKNGDTVAARAAYEQIIAAQPQHADWARLALAGLLESQGQIDEAESQYRAVLKADKTNQEAMVGLIRVYTARGDFSAALEQVAPTDRDARHSAAIQIFDHAAAEVASRMKENREAWEAKKITREAFYKATTTQSQRAAALVTLLRSAPPPENSPDTMKKGQARRVLAASLLSQASTALLNFLETGNVDSGSQADLWLNEFQKELADVQATDPSSPAVEASAK